MQSLLREQDKWDEAQEEKAIEVVKNGLKNNVPLETIAIMTGFTVAEIENLKNE